MKINVLIKPFFVIREYRSLPATIIYHQQLIEKPTDNYENILRVIYKYNVSNKVIWLGFLAAYESKRVSLALLTKSFDTYFGCEVKAKCKHYSIKFPFSRDSHIKTFCIMEC